MTLLFRTEHWRFETCPEAGRAQPAGRIHVYIEHEPGKSEGFPVCWSPEALRTIWDALNAFFAHKEEL